jgi:hypothetical protein
LVERGERLYSQSWKVVKRQALERSYQRSAAAWVSRQTASRRSRQRASSSPQTSSARPVVVITPVSFARKPLARSSRAIQPRFSPRKIRQPSDA